MEIIPKAYSTYSAIKTIFLGGGNTNGLSTPPTFFTSLVRGM